MAKGDEILVETRGHRCPVPALRLRRALETAPVGAVLRLLADDPMARIDVPHMAASVGARVRTLVQEGKTLDFLIYKAQ
jgi:tRNA 2-thiouridine synthesizing protein A